MTPTYRIRDWSKHFENNRTRELKELRFVILPNKHDGDGYTELLDHPNGAAHYGAWCAITQVASKGQHPAGGCGIVTGCCECRGVLLREGARPHDPDSLSRLTRIPANIIAEVLPRLVSIGWMDSDQAQPQENQEDRAIPQPVVTIPHPPAEKCDSYKNGIEENGIEEKKRERHAKPHDDRVNHPALQAVREIRGQYPSKDVWDLIIKTVGAEPDVGRMRECWLAWRGKDFRPNNLGWLTDWYVSGIPGGTNGADRHHSQTASQRRAQNFSNRLAIVAELRGEGGGDHNENDDRECIPARG